MSPPLRPLPAHVNDGTRRSIPLLALLSAVVILPAALYIASGISDGFLEADDFGWLTTARDQAWTYIFSFGGYDHFYRPVIRAWFFGAVRVCDDSSACYHALNLVVHLINIVLFTMLSVAVTRDRLFSALAALIFAVSPGYVEAVAWVSAITELLSTLFLLAAALLVFQGTDRRSTAAWYLAALAAFLAVFAHEASAVLFGLIPLLLWITGRTQQVRPRHVWPFIIVGSVAVLAMAVANQRNPVFTETQYTVGSHAIRQTLDYFVSMYVGPHRWTGRVFVALAAAAIVVFGHRMSRAGVLWMLIICVFTSRAIADHNESSAAYRRYAQAVIDRQIFTHGVTELIVPAPTVRGVDRDSAPPLVRWVLKQRELTVIVDDADGRLSTSPQ